MLADRVHRVLKAVEGLCDLWQQCFAFDRHRQRGAGTIEQFVAEQVFKRDDVAADGALRDVEGLRARRKTALAANRLECPKRIEG